MIAGSLMLANAQSGSSALQELPVSGTTNRDLRGFDDFMSAFLAENQIPGASLAISNSGKLVYARGFGYADVENAVPVEPDSLFRIASVSKPLTATAVMRLVQSGRLALDDKVVDRMAVKPLLNEGKPADERWNSITVLQCLQHTAGWDRMKSGDPIAMPSVVAKALNLQLPVAPAHVVQYAMGQNLDFNPGEKHEYSNVGYLVLGRIIEAVSGESYESFVKKEVLTPLRINAPQLGRALIEHRADREVCYYDFKKRMGPSVYPPNPGQMVPVQYGADNLEGYEAHGGWIASAVDLVKFASAFDEPAKSPILQQNSIAAMFGRPQGLAGWDANGQPAASWYGCGWSVRPVGSAGKANTWHGGYIAGTEAFLVRRSDGLNWAVLFNTAQNPSGKMLQQLIDSKLHEVAGQVKRWPRIDLFSKYLKT